MNQEPTQPSKNTANAKPRDEETRQAAEIVAKAIREAEEALREKATATNTKMILLEGETTTGHEAQVMFPERKVASLQLKYGTATSDILGEERADGFWEELAEEAGLAIVESHE